MLSGTAAKLLASLDLDTKPFERGAARVDKSLGGMEGKFGRVSTRSIALGSAIGTGIERLAERGIGFLFDQIRSGEEGLRQLQDITAQTGAVIESTGGKAGVSAQQIRDLAEAQEALTTVDDKVVQSGENMLLTFTNIGSDVFPQATKAMVDMAVAMNGGKAEGIDLKNTAIQIGKALNDPIKGVGALRRVGVQLTDQQQKQIGTLLSLTKDEQKHYLALRKTDKAQAEAYKTTQIASRLSEAQKIILQELTTEFGKAGEAAGESGAAGIVRLSDAVEEAQIALATGLSPALDRIRSKITEALTKPSTQEAIKHLGEWLGDAAEKGIAFAESIPWGTVADGLKTAAGFAGKLIDAFAHMPPQVQGTILALAGLNKLSGGAVSGIIGELGKGLIKGVLGMTAGVVNVKAGVVTGTGGGLPTGGGAAGAAATGISTLGKVFLVGEAIGLVLAVKGVADAVGAGAKQQTESIHQSLEDSFTNNPSIADMQVKLAAIDTGLDRLPKDPIGKAIFQDSIDELNTMRTQVSSRLEAARSALDRMRDKQESQRIATLSGTSQIVGAIQRNRPIIRVSVSTNVRTTGGAYITGTTVNRNSSGGGGMLKAIE